MLTSLDKPLSVCKINFLGSYAFVLSSFNPLIVRLQKMVKEGNGKVVQANGGGGGSGEKTEGGSRACSVM